MPAAAPTRAAVLYHRERYCDALEVLVSHRDRLLSTDVDPSPDGPDVRLEARTDRVGRHDAAPSERRGRRT